MALEGVMTNMTTGTVGQEIPELPVAVAETTGQETPPAESSEAPAVEKVAEKPKERSAERFAALARKEAEVYRKAQAVRQQQAEIARQAEEMKTFRQMKSQAALNPLDALKQLGLTYEQITEYVLNDNKPTPSAEVMTLKQELEEFKRTQREERDREEQQRREMAAQEQRQIIDNFRAEVGEYISQHAETYELTALYKGAYLVSDVIEENFKQSGKLMSIPEAAKLVEEHYEELARQAQATKKFAATQQKAAPAQTVSQPPAAKLPPTLSNDLNATVTSNPQRPRTDADRIYAALARLEGR
jgi:DNA-binding transcriptional MerR regulator